VIVSKTAQLGVQFIPKNNLLSLVIYFFLRIITLKMKKSITDRKLIIANFTIVSYFVLIWLINVYKIDIVLIGVFRELLTIPFLIAQIVFLVIGINFLIKNQRNALTIISVLSLACCMLITVGSFSRSFKKKFDNWSTLCTIYPQE
jgi:hypothetical protein